VSAIVLLFTIALFLSVRENTTKEKVSVVVTFYPLAEFAKQVGGDKVEVINITSGGVEPHDYEPSSQDIIKIQKSDLFLINGNGLDTWALDLITDSKTRAVVMSDQSLTIDLSISDNQNLQDDPHFWLDPIIAQEIVNIIGDELSAVDPANEEFYQSNAFNYRSSLNELDTDYSNGLTNCVKNKIVVSHKAFSYIGNRYNIDIINISGISPEEEPSAKQLAEISELVKTEGIEYVFSESLGSPELAQTVATEVGVQMLELNPIEGLTKEQEENNEDYVSIMRQNLINLRTALKCQ
jgi:zinc transport system substrate-binding protein